MTQTGMSRRPGWVITFYSYKGGVGRTFALANVATLLARWGQHVLCIDWDLEAPGLANYLLPEGAAPPALGLAHLVRAAAQTRTFDERPYLTQVEAGEGASFQLLAAGNGDPNYASIVQSLDWTALYAEHGLGDALEAARERWRQDYDVVLIDSRTGYADTSGICTIQLPDCLVAVATATHQSLDGLAQVLEHVHHQRSDLIYERGRLLVVPLLNRFDGATEVQLGERWTGMFRERFAPSIEGWLHRGLVEKGRLADFVPRLRVPQVAYWNFGERLPVVESSASDPGAMVRALEDVASLLDHRLESTDRLLDDRDAYVRESRHRRSSFLLDVLVVPLGEVDPRVELVERLLKEEGHRTRIEAQPDHATVAGSRIVLMVNNGNGERAIRTRNGVQKAFWASVSEEPTTVERRVEEIDVSAQPSEQQIQVEVSRRGLLRRSLATQVPEIEWTPTAPTVLIVDDIIVNRKVHGHLVTWLGCRALLAADGKECISILKNEHVDVILMDIHMPDLDGYETARLIRLLPLPVSLVKIIAVTADFGEELQRKVEASGMSGIISKPVNLENLRTILERFAGLSIK